MKKLSIFKQKLAAAGVVVGASIVTSPVFAAVDSQAVSDWKDEIIGDISLVGGALIAAAFAAVIFKWVKAAIFS
ncbi:hypothetical protein [Rheinheimera sp.]|uniref:hypothetical protein n=1 Tax=Rheinheimera sp. TaxID=1869214 RepID=UPI00307F23D8